MLNISVRLRVVGWARREGKRREGFNNLIAM